MELIRAKHFEEVASLAVQSDHGQSKGPAPRIKNIHAGKHDKSEAIVHNEGALTGWYDLIVVHDRRLLPLLSLMKNTGCVVFVEGVHMNGNLLLQRYYSLFSINDPFRNAVFVKSVADFPVRLLIRLSSKVLPTDFENQAPTFFSLLELTTCLRELI